MVRLWSEEVGDAASVIEPLVRGIDPDVALKVDGGEGFRKETVEVRLTKAGQEALCIVTFEAWEHARKDAKEMETAFRKIIDELDGGSSLSAYLLTSRGLFEEPADKESDLLRSIAAGVEADILAEQFFKKGLRK